MSGHLDAFAQIRYLDVFSPGVANAPAATDFSNVRAEFTRTSDGEQQMAAFCTVQDNATFGADFRIAKAMTPVPPPPPPPPETVVSTVSWNGAMGPLDSVSSYMFLGPQQAVHLDAAGSINAGASGTFAQIPNNQVDVNINVCYQSRSAACRQAPSMRWERTSPSMSRNPCRPRRLWAPQACPRATTSSVSAAWAPDR